jgi:hypothetical protein
MNESDNYEVQQPILVKHSTHAKHGMEFDKPDALANIHILTTMHGQNHFKSTFITPLPQGQPPPIQP